MIEITVNGEQKSLAADLNLRAMLALLGFDCARIAVAVNSEFVTRADYDTRRLAANDNVDVVAPMAGG